MTNVERPRVLEEAYRAMFVTVMYGADKEKIFNTNCRNGLLLPFIQKQCQCQAEDVIELADERGVIKHLRRFPNNFAREYLKDRERLVLLRVNNFKPSDIAGQNSPKRVFYHPLLSRLVSNADFIESLNPPREEENVSDTSSVKSSRRSSSMHDADDLRTGKLKSKIRFGNSCRKVSFRRGQRSPFRKSTNALS